MLSLPHHIFCFTQKKNKYENQNSLKYFDILRIRNICGMLRDHERSGVEESWDTQLIKTLSMETIWPLPAEQETKVDNDDTHQYTVL